MSLYETAKANNIRDIPAWLLACGRAYYLYRANQTLTRRMQEGLKAEPDKNELLDARINGIGGRCRRWFRLDALPALEF